MPVYVGLQPNDNSGEYRLIPSERIDLQNLPAERLLTHVNLIEKYHINWLGPKTHLKLLLYAGYIMTERDTAEIYDLIYKSQGAREEMLPELDKLFDCYVESFKYSSWCAEEDEYCLLNLKYWSLVYSNGKFQKGAIDDYLTLASVHGFIQNKTPERGRVFFETNHPVQNYVMHQFLPPSYHSLVNFHQTSLNDALLPFTEMLYKLMPVDDSWYHLFVVKHEEGRDYLFETCCHCNYKMELKSYQGELPSH